MADIFNEDNKVKGNWWKYKVVGDAIQGTYCGKRTIFNQLANADQFIYEIKKDNGEMWIVPGKPAIDAQMQYIRFGQIVGFKFVEIKKSSKPGMSPAKIVQVYANQNVVDEKWLAEQEEIKVVGDDKSTSEDQGPIAEGEGDKMMEIYELTCSKVPGTDLTNWKTKIMEVTGLPFIPANYDTITEKLKGLK